MSKQARDKGRNSSKKARHVIALVIVMAVMALGATAAVSMRTRQKDTTSPQTKSEARANLRMNAQPAPFVMQTAQIKPLTQEEAQKLAEGLKKLVNQSSDGLKQVSHPDGSVSMDLEGRFQSVAVAKFDENGNVVQSCLDNREAAAAFFGIDPQLLGVQGNTSQTNSTVSEKGGDR